MKKPSMQLENALISRICHDLITPFSAISLGMEAFALSKEDALLENLQRSVAHANVILKFTRELFSSKSDTFYYANANLKQVVADFLQYHSISFDLKSDFDSIPNIAAKVIMYTAVIMKEIMPYGGVVTTFVDDESSTITTRGSGNNISIPLMTMAPMELNHKNIMRYNLTKLLDACGFELKIMQEESDVVVIQRLCHT
jgi:hypothetical protein